MMVQHVLKTWPEPFDAVERGDKTFEVRLNDRDYQAGDILVLRRYEPDTYTFTPNRAPLRKQVTFALHGGEWGIKPGYVVMALGEPT